MGPLRFAVICSPEKVLGLNRVSRGHDCSSALLPTSWVAWVNQTFLLASVFSTNENSYSIPHSLLIRDRYYHRQ